MCDCDDSRRSAAHNEILAYVDKIQTCSVSFANIRKMQEHQHMVDAAAASDIGDHAALYQMLAHFNNLSMKE